MLAPQGELSEGDFLRLCLESNRLYPEFRAAIEAETGICCYHREAADARCRAHEADEAEYCRIYTQQRERGTGSRMDFRRAGPRV